MDILSIATVLWYTVQPYLWLVILLLAIFVVSLWVGKERPAADGKA
ncbi:oxidoreductase, partial [Vibrio cholerae]|nr:oxidoreductase [Vibrio cholerae]